MHIEAPSFYHVEQLFGQQAVCLGLAGTVQSVVVGLRQLRQRDAGLAGVGHEALAARTAGARGGEGDVAGMLLQVADVRLDDPLRIAFGTEGDAKAADVIDRPGVFVRIADGLRHRRHLELAQDHGAQVEPQGVALAAVAAAIQGDDFHASD